MAIILVLFFLGIALIIAEFIVPGAVLGALGGIFVIASTAYGWYLYPSEGVFIALGELVGVGVGIVVGMTLLSRTGVADFMTQLGAQTAEAGYFAPAEDPRLVGQEGVVYTDLRPTGWIMIDERRVDAVSEGVYLPKGTAVRVIEVEGHRVVVEPVEDSGIENVS